MIQKTPLNNKLILIKAEQLQQQVRCIEAVLEAGGNPILIGTDISKLTEGVERINEQCSMKIFIQSFDPNNEQTIIQLKESIFSKYSTYPDILINDSGIELFHDNKHYNENIKLDEKMIDKWDTIIQKELNSVLLLNKIFGHQMAQDNGGVILNILSDIHLNPKRKIVDPKIEVNNVASITVANGLLGLTKYIATYWNEKNIRCNSLTIGRYEESIFDGTDRATILNQIPIGRFANNEDLKKAILFLISDASSYMTGSNLVVNGGRTCW